MKHDIELTDVELEAQRLATLKALRLLDTAPEQEFDTIAATAKRLLRCKIALISLVDDKRQWFKAKCGIEVDETPRALAFCARAVEADDALIVADATKDSRFADNPLVTGEPYIRLYAGIPIRAASVVDSNRFLPMGTLCVIDDEARDVSEEDIGILKDLAKLVESLMEARSVAASVGRVAEERRIAMEALKRNERQFRQAERMANVGSWRLTLADQRTEWSDQTYAIHGASADEIFTLPNALDFYPRDAQKIVAAAIERTISTGEPFDLETDFLTAQGEKRRVRSMGELELKDGLPIALIGALHDVTDRHVMEEQLRQVAYTDELTGLASRALFNREVEKLLSQAKITGAPLAMICIDLDQFKPVNDRFGHAEGDDLLRVMARKLRAPYLDGSLAARLGGDEFAILISCPRQLANLRGLLATLLLDLRHTVGDFADNIEVTASIGACLLDDKIHDQAAFMKKADAALYETKRRKRGAALIADDSRLIDPSGPDLRIVHL